MAPGHLVQGIAQSPPPGAEMLPSLELYVSENPLGTTLGRFSGPEMYGAPNFPGGQGVRIHLLTQGASVHSMVREDPT